MDSIINKKITKRKSGEVVIGVADNYLKKHEQIHTNLKRNLTILGLENMISISCKGFNGRGIQIPIRLIKKKVLCLLEK